MTRERVRNWSDVVIWWAESLVDFKVVCSTFTCWDSVASAVNIMYGAEILEHASWQEPSELLDEIDRAGGWATWANRYGREIMPRRAHTGDIAFVPDGDADTGIAMGVIINDSVLMSIPGLPIAFVKLKQLGGLRVWRVEVGDVIR